MKTLNGKDASSQSSCWKDEHLSNLATFQLAVVKFEEDLETQMNIKMGKLS